MRFLSPVLFAAAGLYVAWYNGNHADRVLMLPFMDVVFPATANDPVAQGAVSWKVLLGLAGIFGVLDAVQWARARRREEDAGE